MSETRKATRRLWAYMEDGAIEKTTIISACLNYMSEADVADMCRTNDFFDIEEEEDIFDELSDC